MTFRFIHTADWQLSKSFAQFPSDVASELAAARLSAIRRIAEIAREKRASHVLVAGDVFDNERIGGVALRRVLEHLKAEHGIIFVLLPGNHDAARRGGLWERIAAIGTPANVVCATAPAPLLIHDLKAAILPAPLSSRSPGLDPTAGMDATATPEGFMRIGLAHGSVQGFGSSGESAVLIARDRASRAGLAYLALGDWHGMKAVSSRTWYSGTPEPDRFLGNEPGHVLSVAVESSCEPKVEPVRCATFLWRQVDAAVRTLEDLNEAEAGVLHGAPDPRQLIVRFGLRGALALSEMGRLDAWREAFASRVRHLETDTSALAVSAGAGDLDIFGADGALRETASRLAKIGEGEDSEGRTARLALRRLAAFVAEVTGEAR